MIRVSNQTLLDISDGVINDEVGLGAKGQRVWPVWHRLCRDIAFFYLLPVTPGMNIESRFSRNYNCATPEAGSPIICEACGQAVQEFDLCAHRPGELVSAENNDPFLRVLSKY